MSSLSASPIRRLTVFLTIAICAALYLTNLTAMGMVSVDEPRYAAIGRAMASSGDWITPTLWGTPWFEKPALLYWMVAAGFRAGLSPDLAPRLPVALLSLAFLAFFWFRVRALWDSTAATWSTAILATSAGWLAYSHVAITDLPLAATFSAAVLWSLEPQPSRRQTLLTAAALGVAVLAKSLIALILFAPIVVLDRRWRALLQPAPILLFFAIALPWHIVCLQRNGFDFVKVLFLEHQFGRFSSTAIGHARPFWYYVPVLLMLLFPWFPVLAIAPRDFRDRKLRTLWILAGFGFLFLSASVNKLPHYVLPLLPSMAILMGVGLARAPRPAKALILPLGLLGLLPLGAKVLPPALAHGLGATPIPWFQALWVVAGLVGGLIITAKIPRFAIPAALTVAALAFLWFQFEVFPAVDISASARSLWLRAKPVCSGTPERATIYGLSYYSEMAVPVCQVLDPRLDSVVR